MQVRILALSFLFVFLAFGCGEGTAGGSSDTQSLFKKYFEPYRYEVNVAGTRRDAMRTYQDEKYQEAIKLFDEILDQRPDDAMSFYKGIALLSTDQAATAVPIFETLSARPDWQFQQQSSWYLAMAYLANDEADKAKAALKTHQSSGVFIYKRESTAELIEAL